MAMAQKVDPQRGRSVEKAATVDIGQPDAFSAFDDGRVLPFPESEVGEGMPEGPAVSPEKALVKVFGGNCGHRDRTLSDKKSLSGRARGKPVRPPVFVLSGGAARGVAHLGFLAAAEKAGIRPKAIVGTSAGALMGALYLSSDCTTAGPWARVRKTGYGQILRFAFSRRGIFSSLRLTELIGDALEKKTFEELPVPFHATVTNWTVRSLELLSSGELASAVAASCALPPLFTPVRRGESDYLDGGVLSILPAMAARRIYPKDTLIAVDVNVRSPRPLSESRRKEKRRDENWLSMAIGPLWLSIARASLLERSFADDTLPIPAGDYPLFSLSSIEKIYELGYHEGTAFWNRKDMWERLSGDGPEDSRGDVRGRP